MAVVYIDYFFISIRIHNGTADCGGWTAFYSGKNGSTNYFASFESGTNCTNVNSKCLRRLTNLNNIQMEYANNCGNAMVKFNITDNILNLFKSGTQSGWQSITNVKSIGTTSVNIMPKDFWTGDPSNNTNTSWIIGNISYQINTTFSNSYNNNPTWNYCNSVSDTSSVVRLFYR